VIENQINKFSTIGDISTDLRTIIVESIISNTDVRIETNDEECMYVPKGQPLEVGMIQFLIENGEDIQRQLIDRNKYASVKISLPFDQSLKRKVVVRHCVDNAEYVRVYVKGAPEYVIGLCTQTLTSHA
jgi:magnesium-transporting ATPase (P-type)